MSLVGPRPCLAYECENYLPRHWKRFEAPPGLTGFWQVHGKNLTTFEEMIDMDLYYVNHKSLLLDLSIIARTIPAVVQQVIDQQRKKIHLRRPVIRGGGIRSFSRGSRD
jgi:lipopolysaccharide/colanic/teichoic acid biosynthesis glycosyltransferase